jgi:hypothetical protein
LFYISIQNSKNQPFSRPVVDNFSDFRLKYANYFDSGIVPLVCPSSVRSLFPHLAFALIVNFDAALVRTTGILAQSLFVSKRTAEASQPFMHLIYKTFLHMKPPSLAIRCLDFSLHRSFWALMALKHRVKANVPTHVRNDGDQRPMVSTLLYPFAGLCTVGRHPDGF